MKTFLVVLSTVVVMGLSLLIGCGPTAEPSLNEQQKATKILDEGSPWGGSGHVEVETVPTGVLTTEVEGLQLIFDSTGKSDWAPTTISASGADDYFATDNSTWYWSGSGTTVITVEDASIAELTGVDVQDDEIVVTFEVNSSGGRLAGIDGTYTLRMTKSGS